jgi:hypothetical protein
MFKNTVKRLLLDIIDGLTLNTKIYDKTVEAHLTTLINIPDEMEPKILREVCRVWKKRYLPTPGDISDIYSSIGGEHKIEADHQYQEKRDKEEQEYQQLKTTYAAETKEFRNTILNDKPLTETQRAAKEQVDIYINYAFGSRDLKKEFLKGKTAFTVCYFAHFREFLAGILPELTGKPKGNLIVSHTKPKAYDEEYFKNKFDFQ